MKEEIYHCDKCKRKIKDNNKVINFTLTFDIKNKGGRDWAYDTPKVVGGYDTLDFWQHGTYKYQYCLKCAAAVHNHTLFDDKLQTAFQKMWQTFINEVQIEIEKVHETIYDCRVKQEKVLQVA